MAKIHPKYHTPYVASLFVGALTLVLVLTFGRLGTDTISLFVNFGALSAFLMLHVTVIGTSSSRSATGAGRRIYCLPCAASR